ncbi:MAG TPA: nitroreductase family protein [Candidatus Limnocylindrales bacterium]|jgi:nitroreductase
MDDGRTARDIVLRALRRTRQVRRFTEEPVAETDIQAILEVCRWTGSSENMQPWTFIVIRDASTRRRIGELSHYARHVGKAPLAIAIQMPGEDAESDAYDEGRVAERILIAAGAMDLGAGIGWAEKPEQPAVGELLGVTPPAFVRTIVSIGHPTAEARRPRSGPGTGRRPLTGFVRER